MNKLKELALITVASLAFIMITGVAKADTTPAEMINKISQVPGKVQSHIQSEIVKTKEFQKNSWANAKIQLLNLKKLFIKN